MRHTELFGKHSELETFSADVPDDGEVSSFSMRYSGLPEFRVAVKLEELGLSILMLKATAAKMLRRRALWPDKGRGLLVETAEAAVVPTKVDVIVNPTTQDRTIIVQSADNPPIAIRLSPFETEVLMERLRVIKRLSEN